MKRWRVAGLALLICSIGMAPRATAQVGYTLDITTFYQFGGCNSSATICAGPDTGFLTVTNNGASTFTGTLALSGTSPGMGGGFCPPTGSVTDSFAGTFGPSDSLTFALSPDSSNCGGFNNPNGANFSIVGTVALGSNSEAVNLSVDDGAIHSGALRTSPCDGISSDSFVLQGGAPTGCDNGDPFETTQADGQVTLISTTLDLVANTTCTGGGTTVSIANPVPLQVTGTTALDVSTFTGTFSGTVTAGQTLDVTITPPGTSGMATTGAGTLTATFSLPGAPGTCVPLGTDLQCPLLVSAGSLDIPATCNSPLTCGALTLKDTAGLAGVTGKMVITTGGVPKSIAFNFTTLALTLELGNSALTCASSGGGLGCLGADPETGACGISALTDSLLCTFDTDSSMSGSQFRLVFTPDPASPSIDKLGASNPGQFYYNVFYFGAGNTNVTITLPYPFVTQGATPIHVYSSVTPSSSGGQTCFAPGMEIANAKTLVTLANYPSKSFDPTNTTPVQVHIPALSGGFAYINTHLDYGLKGTPGYIRGGTNNNDAVNTVNPPTIRYGQPYKFMDDAGGMATTQSENVFKK